MSARLTVAAKPYPYAGLPVMMQRGRFDGATGRV